MHAEAGSGRPESALIILMGQDQLKANVNSLKVSISNYSRMLLSNN